MREACCTDALYAETVGLKNVALNGKATHGHDQSRHACVRGFKQNPFAHSTPKKKHKKKGRQK
jgi:hypothetical protein